MDITTLTSLINTFRAETKQDSITPDSLGQLLQRIVNVLGQASETSAVQQITQWKNAITAGPLRPFTTLSLPFTISIWAKVLGNDATT